MKLGDRIRMPKQLKVYDQGTVVVIVLEPFSTSTAANTWDGVTPLQIVVLIAVSGVLLAIILALTWYASAWLKVGSPAKLPSSCPIQVSHHGIAHGAGDLPGRFDRADCRAGHYLPPDPATRVCGYCVKARA